MNTKVEFQRLMAEQTEIALATARNNQPNVRIVNHYHDPVAQKLYFATFADNEKVGELDENPLVSFTTVPHQEQSHVKGQGIARRSRQSIFELVDHFIRRIPGYQEMVEQAGDQLIVYEITVNQVTVTLSEEETEELKLL